MQQKLQIVNGIYLPEWDRHFGEQIKRGELVEGKGTYQYAKLKRALEVLKPSQRHTAIDIGANVGLWTRILEMEFQRVIAIEPIEEYAECLMKNIYSSKVEIWHFPLADKSRRVGLKKGNGVATAEICDNDGDISLMAAPLDIYDLKNIDFIKIDCEGFEWFVVKGAEETIRQNRPIVVVEQKKKRLIKYGLDKFQPAVKLLESWGMTEMWFSSGDHCLGWV